MTRTRRLAAVATAATVLAASACGAATREDTTRDRLTLAASPDNPIDHVIAISIDGLAPRALTSLGASRTPSFHRLLRQGSGTLNARTAVERTRTLPNHTGMMTGLAVSWSGGHGVTFNTDTGTTVHRAAGRYVPSMFDVVHDHGGRTGFYTAKDKFALYDRTWGARYGAADRVGRDNGRDKISVYRYDTEPDLVSSLAYSMRRAQHRIDFVHFAQPDRAGHAYGWMSTRYLTAVRRADAQLGRILSVLDNNATLKAHTAVVLTADHGGEGRNHEDTTKAADYTVPFVVWGPGVAAGADLYALNPDVRRAPGTSQPAYAAAVPPIRNAEMGNVVLDLIDLPAIAGSDFDSGQRLTAFR